MTLRIVGVMVVLLGTLLLARCVLADPEPAPPAQPVPQATAPVGRADADECAALAKRLTALPYLGFQLGYWRLQMAMIALGMTQEQAHAIVERSNAPDIRQGAPSQFNAAINAQVAAVMLAFGCDP